MLNNLNRAHRVIFFKKGERMEYYSKSVFCPICLSKGSEFGEFGSNRRKNALCQECYSLERHRLLWLFMQQKTDIFSNNKKMKLLHFAPEKVFFDRFAYMKNIKYYPCDIVPENYSQDGETVVLKADITSIPFEDGFFDIIICNHVLEHITDDGLAMRELHRVLKPMGWAILQVPIDYQLEKTYEDFSIVTPEGREKAFGQHDHVRWYGRDYKSKLEHEGFKVSEDPFIKKFTDEEMFKYGLFNDEMVYYCKK
jgi:SAM-dependent methyltransferase